MHANAEVRSLLCRAQDATISTGPHSRGACACSRNSRCANLDMLRNVCVCSGVCIQCTPVLAFNRRFVNQTNWIIPGIIIPGMIAGMILFPPHVFECLKSFIGSSGSPNHAKSRSQVRAEGQEVYAEGGQDPQEARPPLHRAGHLSHDSLFALAKWYQ